MEVAVGVDGGDFAGAAVEFGAGRGGRLEVTELAAIGGLEVDEADMVGFGGRVWLGAYLDHEGTVVGVVEGRDVVLLGGVDGVRDEFGHCLVAADGRDVAVFDFENQIAANGAEKKFCIHNTNG